MRVYKKIRVDIGSLKKNHTTSGQNKKMKRHRVRMNFYETELPERDNSGSRWAVMQTPSMV